MSSIVRLQSNSKWCEIGTVAQMGSDTSLSNPIYITSKVILISSFGYYLTNPFLCPERLKIFFQVLSSIASIIRLRYNKMYKYIVI